MYSTLDSLDIVVDEPIGKVALQTDHRTAEEIEADWDLSVVFAALRARNAQYCGKVQAVRFVYMQPPPPRMADFVRRCGAGVQVTARGEALPPTPDPEGVLAEVEAAWLRVGAALFEEEGQRCDLAGLARIEASLRAATEGGPESEFAIQYWTHVLRLGGAAALLMKQLFGGSLHGDDDVADGMSYRWSHGGTLTNLFGRAASFLRDDPAVAPSDLVRATGERDQEGDVMLSLRAPHWPGVTMALTLPILPGLHELEGVALPILAVVIDLPTATKTVPKDTPAAEIDALRARALANNQKHAVTIESADTDGGPLLVVHGHYYAAERLFDAEFMRGLAARLGKEPLMVSVPRRGVLLVQGIGGPDDVARFAAVTQGQLDRADPTDRLSPEVLLWTNGDVTGLARVTPAASPAPAPPKKRGFWSRWFGGADN
jgi:hypothetical protein